MQGGLGRSLETGNNRHHCLRRSGENVGSLRRDCLTGLAGLGDLAGTTMDGEGAQDNVAAIVPSCFLETGLEDDSCAINLNIILQISEGHLTVIVP